VSHKAPACPSVELSLSFSSCNIALIDVNFSLFVSCLCLNFCKKKKKKLTNQKTRKNILKVVTLFLKLLAFLKSTAYPW
jgi:hypothetical protein